MSRQGCYFCKKALQPFQYRRIGLCPQCRRRVAFLLDKPVKKVTLCDVPDGSFSENAKGEQEQCLNG